MCKNDFITLSDYAVILCNTIIENPINTLIISPLSQSFPPPNLTPPLLPLMYSTYSLDRACICVFKKRQYSFS